MAKNKLMGTILGAAALSLAAAAATSLAAPSGPTGTIDLKTSGTQQLSAPLGSTSYRYGGNVEFQTSVNGRTSGGTLYVSVVCLQGSNVVYQWSGDPAASYPLTDQAGDGLNWDGGAASCSGSLIYRVQKGKGFVFTTLDSVPFDVAGS